MSYLRDKEELGARVAADLQDENRTTVSETWRQDKIDCRTRTALIRAALKEYDEVGSIEGSHSAFLAAEAMAQ